MLPVVFNVWVTAKGRQTAVALVRRKRWGHVFAIMACYVVMLFWRCIHERYWDVLREPVKLIAVPLFEAIAVSPFCVAAVVGLYLRSAVVTFLMDLVVVSISTAITATVFYHPSGSSTDAVALVVIPFYLVAVFIPAFVLFDWLVSLAADATKRRYPLAVALAGVVCVAAILYIRRGHFAFSEGVSLFVSAIVFGGLAGLWVKYLDRRRHPSSNCSSGEMR
jgi:hypothetical protein